MDNSSKENHISNRDTVLNQNDEDSKHGEISEKPIVGKRGSDSKSLSTKKPREADKHKNVSSVSNRPTYQRKYFRPPPLPKRKPAPAVSIRMSNASAEMVLKDRQVVIKDLESQVVYLQNQIKDLKIENKTLLDVQNRQSKELKKYCGGITDIPALKRSHNDEIKAIKSQTNTVRENLSKCQSDLKSKLELLSKKDQELDKLKNDLKKERDRKLNQENKKLEDEAKKLQNENDTLKTETEEMQGTIQQLLNKIVNFEKSLSTAEHCKKQLEQDLDEIRNKYDEALKNEMIFKQSLAIPKVMSSTQTEKVETAHVSIMTLEILKEPELPSFEKVSIGVQASLYQNYPRWSSSELREIENLRNKAVEEEFCYASTSRDQFTAHDVYPDIFYHKESNINKSQKQARNTGFCVPVSSSEAAKSVRDSVPLPASEMLKRPLNSVYYKKSIPLSNNFPPCNTTPFFAKEPLCKSNTLMDSIFKMDSYDNNDNEDNLSYHFKKLTTKNIHGKSNNRIESFKSSTTGRKDILSDIKARLLNPSGDIQLQPCNSNKNRKAFFSNLTSKQNTIYPNG